MRGEGLILLRSLEMFCVLCTVEWMKILCCRMDEEVEIFGVLGVRMQPADGFKAAVTDAPTGMRVSVYDQASGAMGFITQAAELSVYLRLLQVLLNVLTVFLSKHTHLTC